MSSDVQIGWQDYLAIAWRRKALFFTPLIAASVLAVLYWVVAPRIYRAEALIAVQSEKLINPLIQGLAMPTAISERLTTLREEILSWSNLNRLMQAHQLDVKLPKNNPLALEGLIKQLRKDIKVRLKGQSLIEVSYEGRQPAKVQELVNSLTEIVIERDSVIRRHEAETAVQFIEAELEVYRQKLEGSEGHLREFKELYMTEMPVVTALNNQLKDLEVQLSHLLINNTEEHPRVVDIKRQIDEIRKQRDVEIERLVAKGVLKGGDSTLYEEFLNELSGPAPVTATPEVEKARQAVAAVVEGLESPEVASAGSTASTIALNADGTTIQINDAAAASLTLAPRQQQELTRLTRDYSVNEAIYRGLLEKLERAKITGRLGDDEQGGKFMIIERARFPLRPISPQLLQTLLIALIGGLVLGVLLALSAEYLDQSIQTAEEATELLDLTVLGAISSIVTEADLEQRRQRRKQWFAWKDHLQRAKTLLVTPVWSRVDQALLRWGL